MAVISAIAHFLTPQVGKQRGIPLTPLQIRKSHQTNSITINPSCSRRTFSLSAQSSGNGDGNDSNGDGLDERPSSSVPMIDLKRWRDLLSLDPENIATVGLTGLLAWASVQALFQLVFISFAIILAAVKYSFIAALLLFILITLL